VTILSRIFPKAFDNNYRGSRIALWLFMPVLLVRMLIGFNSFFFARSVAMTADGIPLDSYSPAAAATVISLFAHLGYFNLLVVGVGLVALIGYRAMIPFMYLMLLVLQLGGRATALLYPIAESGVSTANTGAEVVLGLLALNVVGLLLTFIDRKDANLANEGARA
jgi:hypothetical protein